MKNLFHHFLKLIEGHRTEVCRLHRDIEVPRCGRFVLVNVTMDVEPTLDRSIVEWNMTRRERDIPDFIKDAPDLYLGEETKFHELDDIVVVSRDEALLPFELSEERKEVIAV
jgi:hypothetical protein